jgi:hypothetical protein
MVVHGRIDIHRTFKPVGTFESVVVRLRVGGQESAGKSVNESNRAVRLAPRMSLY